MSDSNTESLGLTSHPIDHWGKTMKIDHFMYAASSLADGMDWAEATFGVRPAHGGAHAGLGTQNALLAFDSSYLEIIAPDPKQDLSGTMGERLAALKTSGLVTWAAEGNLTEINKALNAKGVDCRGPVETKRVQTDGTLLTWALLFPQSGLYGMPFFIDWMDCVHPCQTSPEAGHVSAFDIRTPEATALKGALSAIHLDVPVSSGYSNLHLEIDSPNGTVVLNATEETLHLMGQ